MKPMGTGSGESHSRKRLALATYVKLMRAANSARTVAAHQLSESGLTLTQFAALEALYHLGPMSLSGLAQKVLTTGGNLTMVAGNLEKQGFIQKHRSPSDARVQVVSLAPKGKVLMQNLFPAHAAALVEFMETLNQPEQKTLGELCRKLGRHLAEE